MKMSSWPLAMCALVAWVSISAAANADAAGRGNRRLLSNRGGHLMSQQSEVHHSRKLRQITPTTGVPVLPAPPGGTTVPATPVPGYGGYGGYAGYAGYSRYSPSQVGVLPGPYAPPLPSYPAEVLPVDVNSSVVELGGGKAAAVVDSFEPGESIQATYAPNPEQGYTNLSMLIRLPRDREQETPAGEPVTEAGEPLKATIIPLMPILGGSVTDVPAPEPEVRVEFYIPYPTASPPPGTPAGEAATAEPSPEIIASLTNAVTIRG